MKRQIVNTVKTLMKDYKFKRSGSLMLYFAMAHETVSPQMIDEVFGEFYMHYYGNDPQEKEFRRKMQKKKEG